MLKLKSVAWPLRLLAFTLWLSACTGTSKEVPFPEGESEFAKPVSRPLKFREPKPIQWEVFSPNTLKPPSVKKFNFNALPRKPFNIGFPSAMKKPADKRNLAWKELVDTIFDYNNLPTQPLRFKTTFMLPATIIKAGTPIAKVGATRGVMGSGAGLGLPGNGRGFIQEPSGIMWIATDKGICRYDGVDLEIYGADQGISDFNIWSICEDAQHRIWMGTGKGEVFILDRKAGLIHQLLDTFPRGAAYGICRDRDNQMWIVRNNHGSVVVNESTGTVKMFSSTEGLAENFTISIVNDRKGQIWFSSGGGVTILDPKTKSNKRLTKNQGLISNNIFSIHEDKQGNILLGGNDGFHIINQEAGTIEVLGGPQGMTGYDFVLGLTVDKRGVIWAGTNQGTIFSIDKQKGLLSKYLIIGGAFPFNILEDQEGQLWVGTTNGGSYVINFDHGSPASLTIADGLGSNAIWKILEAQDGLIWMGTTNGIDVYDRSTQTIKHLSTAQGLHSDRVSHIYEDSKGQIWAFGGDAGVTIINTKEGTMKTLGDEQGLKNSLIARLIEDNEHQMWMGDNAGDIYVLNLETKLYKKISNVPELKGGRTNFILNDKKGQIWLGGANGGAVLIDKERKSIRSITSTEGLLSNNVYNFLEDSKGAVWIGTASGLNRLDPRQEHIESFTTLEGLPNNDIWTLNERSGIVLAGTTRGLSMIAGEPDKWTITNYGRTQGFSEVDFDLNSGLVTKQNEFWAGVNIEMLTVMDEPSLDSIVPKTFITGLTILDHRVNFRDRKFTEAQLLKTDTLWKVQPLEPYENKEAALKERFTETGFRWDSVETNHFLPIHLQLRHDQNYLSFSYAGLDFSDPDQVRYRYVLEGIDKNWSPITSNTVSENYRDLPPGSYSFKVRSRGMNGIWSGPAVFSFTILPPWWKSWWAYIGYLILFAFAGWRVHLFQKEMTVRKEREKNRERELVQAREIEKAYNSLKATQSQLIQSEKMASLGELTAGIAHEIQNPLNFVNNFAEVNKELLQEMKEEIDKGRLDEGKAIAASILDNEEKILFHGKRADSIVKGMLQHSRTSNGIKEPTDINALADEYLRLAYHGLRAKDKSFTAGMKTDLDSSLGKVKVVPQDLGRVILNLITNAFHAVTEKKKKGIEGYEPMVIVSTVREGNKVKIIVKDNGNGIPQNIIDKIFQPFFTTKPSGQGTGLGLSMSYDIVTKVHEGQIEVKTEIGEGTSFIITIPNQS